MNLFFIKREWPKSNNNETAVGKEREQKMKADKKKRDGWQEIVRWLGKLIKESKKI